MTGSSLVLLTGVSGAKVALAQPRLSLLYVFRDGSRNHHTQHRVAKLGPLRAVDLFIIARSRFAICSSYRRVIVLNCKISRGCQLLLRESSHQHYLALRHPA